MKRILTFFRHLKQVYANLKGIIPSYPVELLPFEIRMIEKASPYTMTSLERQSSLALAVRYLKENNIPGDFVECGVWRGGSIGLAALLSNSERIYWLFDTFEGMTQPTRVDGSSATNRFLASQTGPNSSDWCASSLSEVRSNLQRLGINPQKLRFVIGDVTKSLAEPDNIPDKISLLRLDTDWYESTRIELDKLYANLAPGGVLIIDDYGHWEGARKAVDEFFLEIDLKPLLIPIDYTGRIGIKPYEKIS